MTELMVKNEAQFFDVRVASVRVDEEGALEVTALAERARCFDRRRLDEGQSPWLEMTNVVVTLTAEITDPEVLAEKKAIAERWRDDEEVLEGFSSVEHQALGLLCRRTREFISCGMAGVDLDRP